MEDIFDKISCYFPINFTPPKDDKFKITPLMLKQKLKSCFLASEHPALLENIFPFLLEKMTQENVKTKIECLDLLVDMSVKFNHELMQQHLEVTLSTISNEYFNRFEADIQQITRNALCSILSAIETKQKFMFKDCAISSFTSQIFKKCLDQIEEEPAGMTAYLGSMLLSTMAGFFNDICTERVITFVMKTIYPKIENFTEQKKSESKSYNYDAHTAYIQVLVSILTAMNGL